MAPRVVLDTNVLRAGLWSRDGASFRLLELVRRRRLEPVLSGPLVLEYELVLKRQAAGLGLAPSEIDSILDFLCEVGHHQRIHLLWRPSLRDPRDELVLELAVAAGCPQIITFNGRDFAGSERLGVTAVTPATFLQKLGQPL